MKRRNFVHHACMACLSGGLFSTILTACQTTHYVNGTMDSNGVIIPLSELSYLKKDKEHIRQYVIVQHEKLEYPIYLYRFSENEFSALWMKCSHQGAALQAAGDHLHCSGHGSEFNNKGVVSQGPAEKNLRTFPVSILNDKIIINLR